jgi:hypothetical protein
MANYDRARAVYFDRPSEQTYAQAKLLYDAAVRKFDVLVDEYNRQWDAYEGAAAGRGAAASAALAAQRAQSEHLAAQHNRTLPASYQGCLAEQTNRMMRSKCDAYTAYRAQPRTGVRQVSGTTTFNGVRINLSGRHDGGDWSGWPYCVLSELPVCQPAAGEAPPPTIEPPVPPQTLPPLASMVSADQADGGGFGFKPWMAVAVAAVGAIVIWKVVTR